MGPALPDPLQTLAPFYLKPFAGFPGYLGKKLNLPVTAYPQDPTLHLGLALPPHSLPGLPAATWPFGRLSLNPFLCLPQDICTSCFILLQH